MNFKTIFSYNINEVKYMKNLYPHFRCDNPNYNFYRTDSCVNNSPCLNQFQNNDTRFGGFLLPFLTGAVVTAPLWFLSGQNRYQTYPPYYPYPPQNVPTYYSYPQYR